MQKRVGIGFLKGLLIGVAVGTGVEAFLHWPLPSGGMLAFLLSIGVGGTAGVFGGRAPWREGAWLEAALKMAVGAAAGAFLYWLASKYASFELPWIGGARRWTSIAPLFLGPIGALYGAVVELDHDEGPAPATKSAGRSASDTGSRSAAKVRVSSVADTELDSSTSSRSARRR